MSLLVFRKEIITIKASEARQGGAERRDEAVDKSGIGMPIVHWQSSVQPIYPRANAGVARCPNVPF
jgi:hypothetical protein